MSAANICRHQRAAVLGAHIRSNDQNSLYVSVKGDGIISYFVQTGEKVANYALSSVKQEVVASVATNSGLAYILKDDEEKTQNLCFLELKNDKLSHSLAAPTLRTLITGPVHSCHGLVLGKDSSGLVVVLQDGKIGLITDETQKLKYLPQVPSPASSRAFFVASHGSVFVAAVQTGQNVTLYIYKISSKQAVTVSVNAPSAAALLTQLSLARSCGLLQWSDGNVTIVKEGFSIQSSSQPARNNTFLVASPTHQVSSSSADVQKRKRKTPAESSSDLPKFIATPLDEAQFVVFDLESGARQSQVIYTVRDLSFGCPISSGTIDLDAPLMGLEMTRVKVVSSKTEASGMSVSAAVLLLLEDAVYSLSLPLSTKPVNLLSLVAKLSLTQKGSVDAMGKKPTGSGFSLAVQRRADADGGALEEGAEGKAASLQLLKQARLPTPVAYHFLQLDDAPKAVGAHPAGQGRGHNGAFLPVQPVAASVLKSIESPVNMLMVQLSQPGQQPPSLELLRIATQYIVESRKALGFFYQRRQRPHPTAGATTNSLVAAVQGPSCVVLPLRFIDLVLTKCTEAGAWSLVDHILEHTDSGSLTCCSELLPALVRAGQYRLIPRACRRLDEPVAEDVVTAIREVFALVADAKAAREDAPSAEVTRHKAARKEYYISVVKTARALVERSEHLAAEVQTVQDARRQARGGLVPVAVSSATGQGHQQGNLEAQAKHAVAAAQCAAAAVDGWTCTQVLLHALMSLPVDSVAIAVAAKAFSRDEVEALLVYLTRWMAKYSGDLSIGAQQTFLSRELLFPRLLQVIDWIRAITDANLSSLLMAPPESMPFLRELQEVVARQCNAGSKLLDLRGAVEHVQVRASLPYAHIAAATQYSAEVLDLRVYPKTGSPAAAAPAADSNYPSADAAKANGHAVASA